MLFQEPNILALIRSPVHSLLHGMWDLLDAPLLCSILPPVFLCCLVSVLTPFFCVRCGSTYTSLHVTDDLSSSKLPLSNIPFLPLFARVLCFAFCKTILTSGSKYEIITILSCHSSSNASRAACWLEKWYILLSEPHVLL